MSDQPTITLPADGWEDYLPTPATGAGRGPRFMDPPKRTTVEVETLPTVPTFRDDCMLGIERCAAEHDFHNAGFTGGHVRPLAPPDRVQLVRPLTDIERTMVEHGIPRGSDDPQAQALGAPPLHQLGSEGVPVGTATVAAIDDHIGTAPDHDWRYLVTLTDAKATTDARD